MYKILANTIFLGKDVHFLPECHSTNDTALSWIKEKKVMEGTIIISDCQTKGRGQRGNEWIAQSSKNLTLSVVLKPVFLDLSEQFLLSMTVANSIRAFLQDYMPNAQVKWPNDLVIPGFGKIGGVLIENTISKSAWEYAVIGIGLNVNQLEFNSPNAVSLASITRNQFDLQELFRLLITHLEQGYISLKKGKFKEIKDEYLHHLFLKDQLSRFSSNGNDFYGTIVGVDPLGRLEIITDTGQRVSFDLKEVSFLEKF